MKTYRYTLDVLQANPSTYELRVENHVTGEIRNLYSGPVSTFDDLCEVIIESIFATLKPGVVLELVIDSPHNLGFNVKHNGLVHRKYQHPNGSFVVLI